MGWAIALHGGAGVDPRLPMERQQEGKEVLLRCLHMGVSALKASVPAIDVVELVVFVLPRVFWVERKIAAVKVRELETNPVFNSGRGSALSNKGTVEMEASIMDGYRNKCGAASGLSTVKNPISLARLIMEKSPHAYIAFAGAEEFAREQGVEIVDTNYFITEENKERLEQAKKTNSIQFDYRLPESENESGKLHEVELLPTVKFHANGTSAATKDLENVENGVKTSHPNGMFLESKMNGVPISIYQSETVGCVAVDLDGHCASATSTGGLINKRSGRIGDSPIIGAGTYANGICAVSATGEGEAIIRATVARDVAALMEYKGLSLQEAVDYVINQRLEDGKGGLIAVSSNGEAVAGFNVSGMFRACATEDGYFEVGIWH